MRFIIHKYVTVKVFTIILFTLSCCMGTISQVGAQAKPVLQSVTMTPDFITKNSPAAQVTLVFNNAAAMAPDKPVITFSPDPGALLTAGSGNWSGLTYTQSYSVNTNDNATTLSDIDVKVSGARDDGGNLMDETTKTDVFNVDMAGYTCKSVTFQPELLEMGAGTLKLAIEYEVPMQTSQNPTVVFADASSNPVSDVNNNLISAISFNWTSTTICVATCQLKSSPQIQALDVHAYVTGAITSGGNPQSPYLSPNTFSVDMKEFAAVITPSPGNVTCADTELKLDIVFNQAMTTTGEHDNITGLVDYDYLYDFLEFEKTEWIDNSHATVTYRVVPSEKSPMSNVKVRISSIKNAGGRTVDKTYDNVFTAVSEPPAITKAVFTAPPCHDAATGSIHLAVSGGNPGYTYRWSNDNEASGTGATPDIEGLEPGDYTVTVLGSDQCTVQTSGTLTNPEGMTVTPEVIQNVLRKDDGIIRIKVEGGTPGYKYYVDNIQYPDSLVKNLATGAYLIEVTDAGNCSITAGAEITDQRVSTAFTPNGDGYNDVFMQGKKVKIFDRNGTLVFEGNDGWDGKYKGATVRPAVYFYIVTFDDGSRRKGSVQIFKK